MRQSFSFVSTVSLARLSRNCDSSDRLFLCDVSGSKASIFVRKTLHIRLRDRNMRGVLQARREGYAFFDEDDVCAGF